MFKAMDHNDNLGYLLHHVSFVMDRQSDIVLQENLGIGFSQFKILLALKWRPGVQQRIIAEKLGQTEASVSRQIKLLKVGGLLTANKSPSSKRERITTLTSAGEKLVDRAMQLLNDYHSPVFSGFSATQQQVLRGLLQQLHQEICSNNKPCSCHNI